MSLLQINIPLITLNTLNRDNKLSEQTLDQISDYYSENVKGALSHLRQFLATKSPLKMMKNAFYFTSKALFVLKMFKFLSRLFDHVSKRFD